MTDQRDLPGVPPQPKIWKGGYPAPPGTGPAGHFCRDCANLRGYQYSRKRWYKCAHRDTMNPDTDVRLSAPACRRWEAVSEPPHEEER